MAGSYTMWVAVSYTWCVVAHSCMIVIDGRMLLSKDVVLI